MKKLFGKKNLIISLLFVLLGGGVAGYFLIFNKNNSDADSSQTSKEIKIESIFGYIGTEANYSKFNALVGMFDSAKYLVSNDSGLEPSLIVFAPQNSAFDASDMKPYDSLSSGSRDMLKLYHMARVYPANETVNANLELVDGQKVLMLAGKEIIVKKIDSKTVIIDGKGRQANVDPKYATTPKGDRIYFIDTVLLFQ